MVDLLPRALIRGLVLVTLAQIFVVASLRAQDSKDSVSPSDSQKEEDDGPVTEESVAVIDGTSDELLDQIDIAGQAFNHPEATQRERAIAVFKIKKLADKIVLRPDASERQREIALKYSLTFVRKGSEMDPETFRPVYDRLVRRVVAEFPNGQQAALAAYMLLADRIAQMEPNANLLGSIKEFQAKYPESQEAIRVFIDYSERLLSLGRAEDTVEVLKTAGQLFGSKENIKKALQGLEAAYQSQVDLLGRTMDLTGPKLGGGTINSRNYLGKVLIVIFWTSQTPNSQAEIKNLAEVYSKYQSQGLDVIGVSFDADAEVLNRFLTENKITWPQIFFQDAADRGANSPIVKKFNIGRLPTLIAVGRDGKIAAVCFRSKETIERIVQQLLSAEPSQDSSSENS